MRRLAILVLVAIATVTEAADIGPATSRCDARRCCTCCDDYCPKPLPCVTCAPIGYCNDYCPKPLPCTAPLRYCGCDDYCPKPCCLRLPPCWPAWYTCTAPIPSANTK